MFRPGYIFILFLLFFSKGIVCADTGFNVYVDTNKKEITDKFVLTVEFPKSFTDTKDFVLPKMPDFIVISQDDEKILKTQDNRLKKNYTLLAKTAGTFTIPSVSLNDGKNKMASQPINVEVYKAGSLVQTKFDGKIDRNILVEAFVDNTSVYVNQSVNYIFRFSTRLDLSSNPNYVMPMFQDFWKGDSKISSGYRLIDGANYFVYEVKTSLYPMKEGDFIIPEVSVDVKYLDFSGSDEDNNEFNKILNSKEKTHSVTTNRVKLKVFPLPETGKPSNFTGAVGRYSISAVVDKNSVDINEPVIVSVTIRGDGNINAITEPYLDLPNDVRQYATSTSIDSDKNLNSKTFKCVIIPLIEGRKTIQPVVFSYFNPNLKDYVVVRTHAISLDVSSSKYKQKKDKIVIDDVNKPDKDIKSIKENISPHNYVGKLIFSKFYIFMHIPFVLFLFYALFYKIKDLYLKMDPVRFEKINAYKSSKEYLQKAIKSLHKEEQTEFYFNVHAALMKYLKYKTFYDYENMTKAQISAGLRNFKIDDFLIDEIIQILIDYEFARYSDIKFDKDRMNKTYDNLIYIFEELDKIK